MELSTKSVGWHVGSVAAGGLAVFSAMASHKVDVYAIWDAMNRIVADVTALLAVVAPVATLFATAYRTWGSKQVPATALAVDVGSPSKAATDEFHPPGSAAKVVTPIGTATGKVV